MATKSEGMSTSKKVIAGAAVGVALPAAVGAAKKLIGDDGDEQPKRTRRSTRRTATSRSKPSTRSKATTSRSTKSRAKTSSNSSSSPTREQLYKMAARLKITGRSNMSKSQLQRAVNRAKSRA